MNENELISAAIQKRLGGDYTVETRTDYRQYDVDSKGEAGISFVFRNPLIESDPEKAKNEISAVLGTTEPIVSYAPTETNKNHMERLAKELEYFRDQQMKIIGGTIILDNFPDWFRELPKRSGWNIKHALNVTKTDTGLIDISIDTPKDAPQEEIVKNIEGRKEAILDMLADRVVKYTPTAKTKEEKDTLKTAVKRLEFNVTARSDGERKSISISIMSPEQLAATKLPGGISADKVKGLSITNPLLVLQDGEDDKDPDKTKPQPHLKKALSRAILNGGEDWEKILPYVFGKEDMSRMIGKGLIKLKELGSANPDLGKRIEVFLADPVFKDQSQWGKDVEKQEFVPESPRFFKMTGDFNDPTKPYEPGVMRVDIKLPADKFPEIRAKLAALDGPVSGQAGSVDAGAIDRKLTTLAEALVTTIQNQQQIANHIVEQENKAAGSNSVLEKAATALVAVANKLDNWVGRVEAQGKAPGAVPGSDEMLAQTILAAAGTMTTQEGSLTGAIAGGASTVEGWSKLMEAQKTANAEKGPGITAA